MRATLAAAFLFLAIIATTCTKKPTEPPNGGNGGPDTTSHNFQFETYVLGDGNASILYDVQVIDENNIWAVGEVFFRDSAGQYSEPAYGLAIWDGAAWNFRRLRYQSGTSQLNIAPIRGVLRMSSNEIWLAAGSVFRWDGTSMLAQMSLSRLSLTDPNATVERLWGTSNQNLHGVGNVGTIVRFNGSTWQQLQSGTTLNVADIWGEVVNGQTEILAVASTSTGGIDRSILKIEGSMVSPVADSGIGQVPLTGLWFSPNSKYYVVGSGIYRKNLLDDERWIGAPLELTEFYSRDVDGNDTNDVIVAGAFGDLLHYNGSTWKQYTETQFNGGFMSVAIRGDVVAAVGFLSNQRAVAVIGRRQ